MNEIDQVGYRASPSKYEYSDQPANLLAPISNWTNTMTNYVHSLYPSHIVTVSYAAQPTYTPSDNSLTDYTPEYIDFIDQHSYTSVLPENSDRENYILGKYYYPSQNYGQVVIEKPRMYGEMGMGSCPSIEGGCTPLIIRHNDEWASAFMTSGAGFFWGDNFDPTSDMADYSKIADFFSNVSSWGVNFENTHFSAINQYKNGIINDLYGYQNFFLVDAAAKSDADPNDQSPASDISLEIGWVSNAEYNWEYDPSNCSLGCGTATTSISSSPPPVLNGVQTFSSYKIYVWDPYTDALQGTYTLSTTLSSNLDFPVSLGTTPNVFPEPDYAYYCYKTGVHYVAVTNNDSIEKITLPNDTVYLPSDSLNFADSKYFPSLSGSFNWDFGNGVTSSKPDAKWIYTNPGEYLLSVKYSEPTKKIILEQTYVVLQDHSAVAINDSTFTIMPNPTVGTFSIVSKKGYKIKEIDIEDAAGRNCFSQLNPNESEFNIASFSAGVYLVRIKTSQLVITKKVVKL